MSKKACITALILTFLSLASVSLAAEGPPRDSEVSQGPTDMKTAQLTDTTCDSPLPGSSQIMLASAPLFLNSEGPSGLDSTCTATATCENGNTVSCTGSSSCQATDASCPVQRGFVKCDGSYIFCGACEDCNAQACIAQCGPPGGGYCHNGIGCVCLNW